MPRSGCKTSSMVDILPVETLTNAPSTMSEPPTSAGTGRLTSLPASAGGQSHCGLPGGPMTDLFGQVLVPASPLAAPASWEGSLTHGTFGRLGLGSSASDALQSSLESRLRARLNGSDLFEVIWKPWITPWGQCRSRPRVRARKSLAIGFGLWPRPRSKMTGAPSIKRAQDKNPNLEVVFSRVMIAAGKSEFLDGSYLTPAFLCWLMRYPLAWINTAPSETRLILLRRRNSSLQQARR